MLEQNMSLKFSKLIAIWIAEDSSSPQRNLHNYNSSFYFRLFFADDAAV